MTIQSCSFVLFLATCILISGCKSSKTKSLVNGKVLFRESVTAPVAIALLDANRLLSTRIESAKITLTDQNKQVVTANNLSFSSLNVTGGVLSLALKNRAQFSEDRPYRFFLKIEADGYTTNYRTILITDKKAQYIPIFMVKLENPPLGMSAMTGNVQIRNSILSDGIDLNPKTSNDQRRKVSVSLAPGTILTSYGKRLSENTTNVSIALSFSPGVSVASLRTFPGGQLVTDAVDRNNKSLATPDKPFVFTTAGWLNLEIRSKDQVVTEFSKPAILRMPVSDSLLNPTTGKPFRDGDAVDTWSLNDAGVWKQEAGAKIVSGGDGLMAEFKISHITPWNLDFKTNVCATTNINYRNHINSGSANISLYCEIVRKSNGQRFQSFGANGRKFDFVSATSAVSPGTGAQTILRGPANTEAEFRVYNSTTGPADLRGTSIFTFCGTTTPPVVEISASSMVSVDLLIDVVDDAGAPATSFPLCNNAVFFVPGSSCPSSSSTAFLYGANLLNTPTPIFSNSAFGQISLRIATGAVVSGITILQNFDVQFNFADRSAATIQQSPVNLNCTTSTGKLATCRWVSSGAGAGGHYYITLPGGTDGLGILANCP